VHRLPMGAALSQPCIDPVPDGLAQPALVIAWIYLNTTINLSLSSRAERTSSETLSADPLLETNQTESKPGSLMCSYLDSF
jgi:hypothetical protein